MPLELLDAAACSAAELAAALRESLLEKHHGGLLLFTHPDERSVLASLLALAAQLPAGQEKHVRAGCCLALPFCICCCLAM